MCKEEEGLSIKWIFNRTNKFQFCGEIESNRRLEVSVMLKAGYFIPSFSIDKEKVMYYLK